MKNVVVFYHGNCPDGFGGAWAAWKKLGDSADYLGINHRDLPPTDLVNKEVYLLDVCFAKEVVRDLKDKNKKVVIIDHHSTNREAVAASTDYRFDLHNSAAVLAWQYFHGTTAPLLLRYIEDLDLWKFELPNAREINTYLELFDFNFEIWNNLARDLEDPEGLKVCAERGSLLLKYENQLVKRALEGNTEPVEFEGYKTLTVNFPTFFASHLGEALIKKMPPIAIIWSRKPGKIVVSLRSDGSVDVSALAAKYGGGGHHNAAGFALNPNQPLPWKYF